MSPQIRQVSSFGEHVGVEALHAEHGEAVCKLAIDERHMNRGGNLHGGAIFAMIDTTMGAATHSLAAAGERYATLEVKVSYLERVTGKRLVCRSSVIKKGKRIAFLESEVTDGEKVVARATGTFALVRDS